MVALVEIVDITFDRVPTLDDELGDAQREFLGTVDQNFHAEFTGLNSFYDVSRPILHLRKHLSRTR